ncbi:MAG TPA: YncE family protein [Thermoplasmata archaeon]|nr:YncE family protein [Thermoplasmata archaeon]
MTSESRGTTFSFAHGPHGRPRIAAVVLVLAVAIPGLTAALTAASPLPHPAAVAPVIPEPSGQAPPSRLADSGASSSPFAAGWHPAPGVKPAPDLRYHLNSVTPASASCLAGVSGSWMAYDSADGSVWVADGSSCVNQIQPATTGYGWNLTASVPVGTTPFGVAYDSKTGYVFVTNSGSDNVSVINASTARVIGSVPVGTTPMGVAADPSTGEVYVANWGSDDVTVIADSNLTATTSIGVGANPVGVAYDPATGQVFVANEASNNVSVVSDSLHVVVATIATGNGSYGVAVDNLTDQVYVTNSLSTNISVINATTDTLNTTIPVVSPGVLLQGIAFDSATGLMWVGGGWSYAVVVNTSQQLVVGYAGTDPSGVVYDPGNGDICVTNTANATFECFSFGSSYIGTVFTPAGWVKFNETGLPLGTSWAVTVNSSFWFPVTTTQWGTTPTIRFGGIWDGYNLYPTYYYAIDGPPGYVAVPAGGSFAGPAPNSTVLNTTVNVTFSPIHGTYPVSFDESGLPNGTAWAVGVNGVWTHSSSTSATFRFPNGTYPFTVGQAGAYAPSPSSGNLTVNGAPVHVAVAFAPAPTYAVRFHESGLPAGSTWDVWLGGGTLSSISTVLTFNVSNGTYSYVVSSHGFRCVSSPGNLTVAGAALDLNVSFVAAPYTVTFSEVGLPSATTWSVTLGGVARSGTVTVSFPESNGTYGFTIGHVPSYAPNLAAGNVTVAGRDLNVSIIFSSAGNLSFAVRFTESGLPTGTTWSVTLGGASNRSNGTTIGFRELAGTYNISIGPVPGYNSSAPHALVVTYQAVQVVVTFVANIFALSFVEHGLPTGTGWAVVIGSQVQSSLNDTVTFEVPDGTYGYVVLAISGYVTSATGTVSVNGSARQVNLTFVPETFPVEFVEFGLPAGSNWSVTVSNATTGFNESKTSSTNAIVFFLPNGTYSVTFTLPAGYTGTSSSNLVIVAGKTVPGPTISAHSTASGGSAAGSPSLWLVALVGLAGLAGGVLLHWAVRKRGRPPTVATGDPSRTGTETSGPGTRAS